MDPKQKYFDDVLDTIICGNNVNVLKKYPDECIDLVVTSPPYDQIRNYNKKLDADGKPKNSIMGQYAFPFKSLVNQLFRVTKMGGIVVWVVGDQTIDGNNNGKTETANSFRQALYFINIGFNLHDTMIYQKPGVRFPDRNRYHQCFEYMFVFSKGKPKTVHLIKDRKNTTYKVPKTNIDGKTKNKRWADDDLIECHDFDNNPLKEFGARYNIWTIKTEQSTNMNDVHEWNWHPAIFPSALARDHIITWSNEKDVVLDPFSGSGTTAKEAKRLNRHYIGIDINHEYVDKSIKRLENYGTTENNIETEEGDIPFIEF